MHQRDPFALIFFLKPTFSTKYLFEPTALLFLCSFGLAQKQISNLADVDKNYFIKKTGNKNFSKINVSKFVKNINTRSSTNRNELMCQYAYVYDFYIKSNHNNYALFLAKKLNYSENYIKNLTKELFEKKYLLKNTKGVPGGVFSKKTLKYFNSL